MFKMRLKTMAILIGTSLLWALSSLSEVGQAEDSNQTIKRPRQPLTRDVRKIPEGILRTLFLRAAGKEVVLHPDGFDAAIKSLAQIADIPENVRRAKWKSADANSDGSVDWFEFHDFISSNTSRKKTPPQGKIEPPAPSAGQQQAVLDLTEPPVTRFVPDPRYEFRVGGSPDEFARLYPDDPELEAIALAGDTDGDGKLSWTETNVCIDKICPILKERRLAEMERVFAEQSKQQAEIRARLEDEARARQEGRAPPPPNPEEFDADVRRRRAEILTKHDADGNGTLDEPEWKNYIRAERRARRDAFLAAHNGKLTPDKERYFATQDTVFIWTMNFDNDHDGVLDREEAVELTRRFSEELNGGKLPSQFTSPLNKEFGPLKQTDRP